MSVASPEHADTAFQRVFGHRPDLIVRAPGRVNLIGDHTDYTGGLVLPMAIDRALLVAAKATGRQTVEVHSAFFDNTAQISLAKETVRSGERWSGYILGVIALLKRRDIALCGARLWIGGDLPPGGGLASSAALEVGVATAMLALAGETLPPDALAALCRDAEHEFAGSPCGIMDQLCCASAQAGHALLIDCQSEDTQHIPLNLMDCVTVVIDSGVGHSIGGSEYAGRRRECAAALERIQEFEPSIGSLRDMTPERIQALAADLGDALARRARHVVTENARVARAVTALDSDDSRVLGRLMSESHESLRDDFEVSCEQLDAIVSAAKSVEGVYGARLTGGGFGGCAIALARYDTLGALQRAVHRGYPDQADSTPAVFPVQSANGTEVILRR